MIGSGTLTKALAEHLARTGYDTLNDDAVQSTKEQILDLASRVKPILDRELDKGPMDVKPQVVEILTRDGKCVRERIEYPKGNPNNPVTSDELVKSFRVMAGYSAKPLRAGKIDEAISLVLRLEEVPDVSMITQLLTY